MSKKYFYNSPNKKVAVCHEKKEILVKLAEGEGCEIIIRDWTGEGILIINRNK